MKDSFSSFRDAEIEAWVVNIRGACRKAAGEFLRQQLGNKLFLFELNSAQGWFHDTRQMLSRINSGFVFFWLEDHLCVSGPRYLNDIVAEMEKFHVESLGYTFYHGGASVRSLAAVEHSVGEHLLYCDYTAAKHRARLAFVAKNQICCSLYILSVCSILSTGLFKRVVLTDDPFFKRWPNYVPFDFEKSPIDTHWLPVRMGFSRKEIFASVDDDHGLPGSSLISRGFYKARVARASLLEDRQAQFEAQKKKPLVRIPIRIKEAINFIVARCRLLSGLFSEKSR